MPVRRQQHLRHLPAGKAWNAGRQCEIPRHAARHIDRAASDEQNVARLLETAQRHIEVEAQREGVVDNDRAGLEPIDRDDVRHIGRADEYIGLIGVLRQRPGRGKNSRSCRGSRTACALPAPALRDARCFAGTSHRVRAAGCCRQPSTVRKRRAADGAEADEADALPLDIASRRRQHRTERQAHGARGRCVAGRQRNTVVGRQRLPELGHRRQQAGDDTQRAPSRPARATASSMRTRAVSGSAKNSRVPLGNTIERDGAKRRDAPSPVQYGSVALGTAAANLRLEQWRGHHLVRQIGDRRGIDLGEGALGARQWQWPPQCIWQCRSRDRLALDRGRHRRSPAPCFSRQRIRPATQSLRRASDRRAQARR